MTAAYSSCMINKEPPPSHKSTHPHRRVAANVKHHVVLGDLDLASGSSRSGANGQHKLVHAAHWKDAKTLFLSSSTPLPLGARR